MSAAGSVLALPTALGLVQPSAVFGAEGREPRRVAIIGAGRRGLEIALRLKSANPAGRVVALADLFPDPLAAARKQLSTAGITVPEDRCFSGFDAYKRALDLADVECVVLTAPTHFRPLHFRAAVDSGKHVFLETPVAVDPAGVRTIREAGAIAATRRLSVLSGLNKRHSPDYIETVRRVHDGAIGSVLTGRAYHNTGTRWVVRRGTDWSEMEYQIRNWRQFRWLGGDLILDDHVANLDVLNWALKGHPVRASGSGGRQVRGENRPGDTFDHFSVEFEYASGARVFSFCRQMDGAAGRIGEALQGTLGTSDCRGSIEARGEKPWRFGGERPPTLQAALDVFLQSIGASESVNETALAADATLTAILGREAAYSGQVVEWDSLKASTKALAPEKYTLDAAPPAPMQPTPGRYRA